MVETTNAENNGLWHLPKEHADKNVDVKVCDKSYKQMEQRIKSNGGKMKAIPYEQSLEVKYPNLAKEWHPIKNGNLRAENVTPGSNKKVWWYLLYDDIETGKHYKFEWLARICNRVYNEGQCPYLTGHSVWPGFNDLQTKYPELSKEWHPFKNGNITPENVSPGSSKQVWWCLPYDDPDTGKHFDFEWRAIVSDRIRGNNCPFISGQAVWRGYNDLRTKRPDLAKEWHPSRNGNIVPEDVSIGCIRKVWWYLSYDDPNTKKHFNFEWKETVNHRCNGTNCPYLSGRAVWIGFNDLKTYYPDLAKEWHPTKNGNLTPENVSPGSSKRVWWYIVRYDEGTDEYTEYEWQERIFNRVRVEKRKKDNRSKPPLVIDNLEARNQNLAKEWHPTKNGRLLPNQVKYKSVKKVWWYLPYDDIETGEHFEFEWRARIDHRNNGVGCPFLTGRKAWPGYNDLAKKRPDLLEFWDWSKNNKRPQNYMLNSNTKVWWKCSKGHSWRRGVNKMVISLGCPACRREI